MPGPDAGNVVVIVALGATTGVELPLLQADPANNATRQATVSVLAVTALVISINVDASIKLLAPDFPRLV